MKKKKKTENKNKEGDSGEKEKLGERQSWTEEETLSRSEAETPQQEERATE